MSIGNNTLNFLNLRTAKLNISFMNPFDRFRNRIMFVVNKDYYFDFVKKEYKKTR